ncbi:sialate O-acetylesterase [Escherichia coli]|nr:sialate O-acetylesterase [Escherichia coli]EIA3553940.1 sialate O-acetylesterase [Escherichia coli]
MNIMTSKWVQLSSMPGNFTVKVSGGTAAFLEAPFPPTETKGGMTFADCLISFNTRDCLWVRPVSGDPNVEITGAGIGAVIPLSADVAGTTEPSDWNNAETYTSSAGDKVAGQTPSWYYVVVIAGQSNASSFGEGLPLPDTYDRPDPRIKQLARRNTVTPGGVECAYNDIIPADHCLHDVLDMSNHNHPKADLSKGQYGCVGQGLHIAKKLLPFIPEEAGIFLVPCARGGSAFTDGADGEFTEASGATSASSRWGVNKPLFSDLVNRTKAALSSNPRNILLSVVWMQGENDLKTGKHAEHSGLFVTMVETFRRELSAFSAQSPAGDMASVPWICGDTTYYWKNTYPEQYKAVYGKYANEAKNIHFVPFVVDENGKNVPTNNPDEDPDIPGIGYYGAISRDSTNWTSNDRASHFSSWARRGIISDRLATAILTLSGQKSAFFRGVTATEHSDTGKSEPEPTGDVKDVSDQMKIIVSYTANAPTEPMKDQGWNAASGKATFVTDAAVTGGNKALRVNKAPNSMASWKMYHPITADNARDLFARGGDISLRFKIPSDAGIAENRYGVGIYWAVSNWPDGDGKNNLIASCFLQTDSANLNVMYHKGSGSQQIGSYGVFDHEWHTLSLRFAGGNSMSVTPVLDGKDGEPFELVKWVNAGFTVDQLTLTDITGNAATYPMLFDTIKVQVNDAVSSSNVNK